MNDDFALSMGLPATIFRTIHHNEYVDIIFYEMKDFPSMFSLSGSDKYTRLIVEMLSYFRLENCDKYYNQFRFFRIWFFLQRHRGFAFKPFFTNFHATGKIGEY
ncbi:uncharacterized DUF3289 family protein [Trabulsiella guamensis ATCC 49490]|uniref:Uncharacterized DUF3289 family protein n=1 Tax=Trabulsiella guamensis ATCC 49490 TaxID=1005994 RepID=A0A085AB91_9ENTR|nr:uncharacterized DUF3289 family protein [Trabulsiella guamensis ATCC 49490]